MDDLNEIRDIVSNTTNARKNLLKAVQKRIRAHLVSILKQGVSIAAKRGTDSIVVCMEIGDGDSSYDEVTPTPLLAKRLGVSEGNHTIKLCWDDFSQEFERILGDLDFEYVTHRGIKGGSLYDKYVNFKAELSYFDSTLDEVNVGTFDFILTEGFNRPKNEFVGIYFGAEGDVLHTWEIGGFSQDYTYESMEIHGYLSDEDGVPMANFVSVGFPFGEKETEIASFEHKAFLIVAMQFNN